MVLQRDALTRFKGYGWNTIEVKDANIWMNSPPRTKSSKIRTTPTLIVVDSHIGYGSPQNTIPMKPTESRWVKPKSN